MKNSFTGISAKHLLPLMAVASISISCKDVTRSEAEIKSITIIGDGAGYPGLADLSFSSAGNDICDNGGLIYEVYADKNSNGLRDSSEGVKQSYKNCNIESASSRDDERYSMMEFKAGSGDVQVTSENFVSYLQESLDSRQMFRELALDYRDGESIEGITIPAKLRLKEKAIESGLYPGVFYWDTALVPIFDTESFVVTRRNIINFDSLKYATNLKTLYLSDVAVKSSQLPMIASLKNIERIGLIRTSTTDTSPLLPLVENSDDLRVEFDLDWYHAKAGVEKY